jgi:hypothetical protein
MHSKSTRALVGVATLAMLCWGIAVNADEVDLSEDDAFQSADLELACGDKMTMPEVSGSATGEGTGPGRIPALNRARTQCHNSFYAEGASFTTPGGDTISRDSLTCKDWECPGYPYLLIACDKYHRLDAWGVTHTDSSCDFIGGVWECTATCEYHGFLTLGCTACDDFPDDILE